MVANNKDENLDIWTEIKVGSKGISVTLYSESESGEVIVEDEWWATRSELEDMDTQITLS